MHCRVSKEVSNSIVALAVVSETCGSVLKFFVKLHPSPFHSVLAYKVLKSDLSFSDALAPL